MADNACLSLPLQSGKAETVRPEPSVYEEPSPNEGLKRDVWCELVKVH